MIVKRMRPTGQQVGGNSGARRLQGHPAYGTQRMAGAQPAAVPLNIPTCFFGPTNNKMFLKTQIW